MESPESREATELRLSLPGTDSRPATLRGTKRAIAGNKEWCQPSRRSEGKARDGLSDQPAVGWPPVRSFNRRLKKSVGEKGGAGIFVKVSMDGAPYLRKIDLNIYKGYEDLKAGIDGMFKCFILGDGCDWSDYVMAFEDKDGDWMMVGDVPWEMFITSCERLRVMKGSEAIGSDRSQ